MTLFCRDFTYWSRDPFLTIRLLIARSGSEVLFLFFIFERWAIFILLCSSMITREIDTPQVSIPVYIAICWTSTICMLFLATAPLSKWSLKWKQMLSIPLMVMAVIGPLSVHTDNLGKERSPNTLALVNIGKQLKVSPLFLKLLI